MTPSTDKEKVPWISATIVVVCLFVGFFTPMLVLNQTIQPHQGQMILFGSIGVQTLACFFGFFHTGKDFPRLFWMLGPVILLSIVLILTLIPDFAFAA